jgi:hypothetical protein
VPFARIATIASVTALLALAGCDHAPPTPAAIAVPSLSAASYPPVPAEVDAGSGRTGLDRFVAAVQQKLPGVALDRRDEELEDLGTEACDALSGGRSATAAAGEITDEGVTPADARALVGLARADLCRA